MIARSMKGKILVFAIFFIGIASGVLVANFYDARLNQSRLNAPTDPDQRVQRAQRDINKFWDYLGLTEEQREKARMIGEETQNEFRKLRQETQPRFQAIEQESRNKIRALLTDEQRDKYDEFRKRRDERFKNRNRDRENRDQNKDSSQKP
jgi:Spy/CpxP family protein refolding chaperone